MFTWARLRGRGAKLPRFYLTAVDTRSVRSAASPDLGLLEDQVVSVAHIERGENIRIISIRKATKHEARFYFSQIVD